MPRITLCSLLIGLGTLTALATMAVSERQLAGGTAKLLSVTEMRRVDYRPKDEDAMTFSSDEPGLTLDFKVQLPNGMQLADVQQPTMVRATDSKGTDLSDVEPDFMGDKSYITMVHSWEGPPTEMQLKLALPARDATTFSLQAVANAQVFASHKTSDIVLTTAWQSIDGDVLGVDGVKIRFENTSNGPTVHVQPGTVKDRIESLELLNRKGEPLESTWTQWTDMEVGYTFMGEGADGMTARIKARLGYQLMPIEITLNDQPLP